MKKLIIWLCIAAALILFFAGASALYEKLSGESGSGNLVIDMPQGAQSSQGSGNPDSTPSGASSGQSTTNPAPNFTVLDKDGNTVEFSSKKGKPIILNFWASWCPPCKAEMPDFDKLYRELDGDVIFMMVNVWDTQDAAESIINSMGYSFPVYYDFWEDAASAYAVESIPQTYFIDKWGGLVAYAVGALAEDELRYGISLIYE